MLQEHLNTTSHSTEKLIEKRQILNSVLIQQVSQPCNITTQSQPSNVMWTGQAGHSLLLQCCSCTFVYCSVPFCRVAVRCSPSSCFSTVAMSDFLRGGGGRKVRLHVNPRLCWVANRLRSGLTLTVCSGLDMWWLCRPPPLGVCLRDGDILGPLK